MATKIPTKAEFAKMSKAEQQKWLDWDEKRARNTPIVDPFPAVKKTKKTATKKKSK